MKIAVIGTGYVGLVSGVCFSEFGFEVVCVDNNSQKIDLLNSGGVPIYEPGLNTILRKNINAKRLSFTTSTKDAVSKADIVFIAVGTPSNEDGSANLDYVYGAAGEIAQSIRDEAVLVVKSTVPVGTTAKVKEILRKNGKKTSVAFNPEFLKEGAAIEDFMHPDRVILGVENEHAKHVLSQVYRPLYIFNTPIVFTNLESAELCKYASNAFLAMKVAFINEIADLCEKCNADVNDVALAMGLDSRIGNKFLQAGPGFGGSCFPKDTSALADFAEANFGVNIGLVKETIKSNSVRKINMVQKIINACGCCVKGKKLTILGVTFKANTDDIRESPSLDIIPRLIDNGANITVYDPSNSAEAKKILTDVKWANDVYDACENSDAVVVITDWSEFKALDVKQVCQKMSGNTIIDLRNIFDISEMKALNIDYHGIGRN